MNKSGENKKHLGRVVPAKIPISAKGLLIDKDIYEQLKFAYAVSPRNTIRAFKEVGVVITSPEDLVTLANLHNAGMDVSGFRSRDGKVYAFNVREILNRPPSDPKSIKVSKTMMLEAPIQWTDMVVHQGQVKIV